MTGRRIYTAPGSRHACASFEDAVVAKRGIYAAAHSRFFGQPTKKRQLYCTQRSVANLAFGARYLSEPSGISYFTVILYLCVWY